MKRDPLAAMRLADPARRVDLNAVDDRALGALREAIIMTPRPLPQAPGRRRARVIAATTTAVALLGGGGVAYATYSTMFAGGVLDGITCMSTFVDPESIDPWNNPTFGGGKLTADPIADCATYAAKSSNPAIADPVAFRYKGFLIVAPAAQLPAGAERVARPAPGAEELVRLTRALADLVDRPAACMTAGQAKAFAETTLGEVGVEGWTVEPATDAPKACFFPVAVEASKRILLRHPSGVDLSTDYVEDPKYAPIDAQLARMTQALRTGISDSCLSLSEAEELARTQAVDLDRVTRSALGNAPGTGTPVIAELDGSQSCSTVDVKPGGSLTIIVRGPETAKR